MSRALCSLARRATRVYACSTVTTLPPLQQQQQQQQQQEAQLPLRCGDGDATSTDAVRRLAVCTSALCVLLQQQQPRSHALLLHDGDTHHRTWWSLTRAARVCARQLAHHTTAVRASYVLPLNATQHILRVLRHRAACALDACAAQQLVRGLDGHIARTSLPLWPPPWLLDALHSLATVHDDAQWQEQQQQHTRNDGDGENDDEEDVDEDSRCQGNAVDVSSAQHTRDATTTTATTTTTTTTAAAAAARLTLAHDVLQSVHAHVPMLTMRQTAQLLWCIAALELTATHADTWRLVCRRYIALLTQQTFVDSNNNNNNNNNSNKSKSSDDVDEALVYVVRAMLRAPTRVVYAAHTQLMQTLCERLAHEAATRQRRRHVRAAAAAASAIAPDTNSHDDNDSDHNNSRSGDDEGECGDDDDDDDECGSDDAAAAVDADDVDVDVLARDVARSDRVDTAALQCWRLRLRLLTHASTLPAEALLDMTRDVVHTLVPHTTTHDDNVNDSNSNNSARGDDDEQRATRARLRELCVLLSRASRMHMTSARQAVQWLRLTQALLVCVQRTGATAPSRPHDATTRVGDALVRAVAATRRSALRTLASQIQQQQHVAHTSRHVVGASNSSNGNVSSNSSSSCGSYSDDDAAAADAAVVCDADATLSALLHGVGDAHATTTTRTAASAAALVDNDDDDEDMRNAMCVVVPPLLDVCVTHLQRCVWSHTRDTTVCGMTSARVAAMWWHVATAADVLDTALRQRQQQHRDTAATTSLSRARACVRRYGAWCGDGATRDGVAPQHVCVVCLHVLAHAMCAPHAQQPQTPLPPLHACAMHDTHTPRNDDNNNEHDADCRIRAQRRVLLQYALAGVCTHLARAADSIVTAAAVLRLLCCMPHASSTSLVMALSPVLPLLLHAFDAHVHKPALLACLTRLLCRTSAATRAPHTHAATSTTTAAANDNDDVRNRDDTRGRSVVSLSSSLSSPHAVVWVVRDALLDVYVRALWHCVDNRHRDDDATLSPAQCAALRACFAPRRDDVHALERGFALMLTRRRGTAPRHRGRHRDDGDNGGDNSDGDGDTSTAALLPYRVRLPLSTLVVPLLAHASVLHRAARVTSVAVLSALLTCAARAVYDCRAWSDLVAAATLLTLADDDDDVCSRSGSGSGGGGTMAALLRQAALAEAVHARALTLARAASSAATTTAAATTTPTTAVIATRTTSGSTLGDVVCAHATALQKAQLVAYFVRARVPVDEQLLAAMRAMPSSA